MAEKHLYICDECQKEAEQKDRYPVDKMSGWIRFNGILEYGPINIILAGEHDFCSLECFLKHIEQNSKKRQKGEGLI